MISDFMKCIQLMDCGLKKVKIGRPNDGGYVLLDELNKNVDVVYSFGIENDISFDYHFAKTYPNSIVRMYDHTINWEPVFAGGIFYKIGVGPEDQVNVRRLDTIVKENKDENRNLLLKMDIEGNEWSSLCNTPIEVLKLFSQITIELHDLQRIHPGSGRCIQNINLISPFSIEESSSIVKLMQLLTDNFYIYHAHANNGFPIQKVAGCNVPPILELSFVRKDLVNAGKVNYNYDAALDAPNNVNLPEISLDFWPFVR